MKRIISIGMVVIVLLVMAAGCGVANNTDKPGDGKSYNVNGVTLKLDKEDSSYNIKFKTSKSFEKNTKSGEPTYSLYKDESKDNFDLSNIVFRVDVRVDIMNYESKIEREIELVKSNDGFKNVEQSQKNFNGTDWTYFSFDNTKDDNVSFKEHYYLTEKQIGEYYYTYKIYFSFAENTSDFEEAFIASIIFG